MNKMPVKGVMRLKSPARTNLQIRPSGKRAIIESDLPNNTYLSVYNDGYNTVHIRSNALESMNNILLIYNSIGHKICEIKNPPKDYYLNTSDYSSGFYIAILHIGGQKSESAKFFVK